MYHKTLQFIFFYTHAFSYMSFADTFVHLLYLLLSSFFLVSNTCVSLFLLSSLSITSRKDKLKELLQSKKTCLSIYLFVEHFFIFICLCIFCFFRIFFVLFSCVFEQFSFWVLVLECFFLCRSLFYVSRFLKTLFGLIILFLSFFSLLLHTLLVDKNVKWRFPKRVDRLRGRYQSQCASRRHGWHGDEAKRSKQTWQNVKSKTKMNLELNPSLSSH